MRPEGHPLQDPVPRRGSRAQVQGAPQRRKVSHAAFFLQSLSAIFESLYSRVWKRHFQFFFLVATEGSFQKFVSHAVGISQNSSCVHVLRNTVSHRMTEYFSLKKLRQEP